MEVQENFKKIFEIKERWIEQIQYCERGVGLSEEINYLKEQTIKVLKEVIPDSNTMLRRELDRLEKEPFTIWSDVNSGYVSAGEAGKLKKWFDFVEKVIKELKVFPLKVYLDANIISDPSKINNIHQEEIEALKTLSESLRIKFYVSEKVKEEIEKHENPKKKNFLLFLYNLIQRIPQENTIRFVPATFGSVLFGSSTFGGGASSEDPLFTKLKNFFKADDAEHIFQAEKNNLDYFLTLDEKTILERIRKNKQQFQQLNLKIRIVSPSQLIKELELTQS